MIITYHGGKCFKISQGELSLVLNPESKMSADVTLFTTGKSDVAEKSGFIIEGPGEYEIKNIFIKGFLSTGPKKSVNTVYKISFESMNLCFLGALSDAALSEGTLEAMEDIDILFVPIGGGELIDPVAAYKLAVSLEPSVIIPMSYTKETLNQFLKEGDEGKIETLDKFVVKKKDLEGKESQLVVLKQE